MYRWPFCPQQCLWLSSLEPLQQYAPSRMMQSRPPAHPSALQGDFMVSWPPYCLMSCSLAHWGLSLSYSLASFNLTEARNQQHCQSCTAEPLSVCQEPGLKSETRQHWHASLLLSNGHPGMPELVMILVAARLNNFLWRGFFLLMPCTGLTSGDACCR